ncbi:MAG: RidA family protein [Verrucomicrobia bacterium]|jgi:enamine deaminase RidA (YjgF/YER057c/UK114 family)|nr:RidA family protein [Verrucomicrobiota bacterium]
MTSPESKLAELNLKLPPAPAPAGVYKPLVTQGNLAYVSGHGPVTLDGSLLTGRVGADVDKEQGKLAARQVGLTMLATLKNQLGSLDKVARVIKVLGMVNASPDFEEHPYVINGCSELFAEIFGTENGIGSRSAVGMGSLPGNITVEIEAMFELKNE